MKFEKKKRKILNIQEPKGMKQVNLHAKSSSLVCFSTIIRKNCFQNFIMPNFAPILKNMDQY